MESAGSNAVSDTLGAIASAVASLAVHFILVVAVRAHLQLLMAVVAVEASLVEYFVGCAAFFRRVNRLLAPDATVTATETEGFA